MTDVSKMTLKVLYTLDDGSNGSYLARSKRPQQVSVANIPNPSGPGDSSNTTLRIGAVNLSLVLKEIQLNSPEFLEIYNNNISGLDYNIYYRDICEVDEPLVSLGLLSKIRSSMKETNTEFNDTIIEEEDENDEDDDEDKDEDDAFIVTGRVCSNFSALLRRSYSNSSKKKKSSSSIGSAVKKEEPISPETLEIKLRLKRVITKKSSLNKNDNQNMHQSMRQPQSQPQQQQQQQQYIVPTINNVSKSIRATTKHSSGTNKRQTNPMPAPKAKRTQSLPIWDVRANINTPGLLKTSIAHKIYLADRQTETLEKQQQQQQQQQQQFNPDALSYEMNYLQSDNTVSKVKVDDSISKRFDFINRKKSVNSYTAKSNKSHSVKKPSKKTTMHSKNKILPTMATIPVIPNTPAITIASITSNTNLNINDPIQSNPTPIDDDLEADKENIPPQDKPMNLGSAIDINLLNFNDEDMDWLENFNTTTRSLDLVGIMNSSSIINSKLTPRDVPTVEDMDRTSPIDTLSMPLMELEQAGKGNDGHASKKMHGSSSKDGSNKGTSTKVTTCQDQLRRLPILSQVQAQAQTQPQVPQRNGSLDLTHTVHTVQSTDNINSDATLLVNYSTPSKGSEEDGYSYDDDELEQKKRNSRIIPSSPGMMFNYRSVGDEEEQDDIFSSFVNNSNGNDEGVDTPATTEFSSSSSVANQQK